jgi:hypothetical protein
MGKREALLQEILDRELAMFLSVRAREPVSCQQDPEGFRLNRAAQFSVWSEETLDAYRNDLERAGDQGQNLMTLKYARMENLIPKLHEDILVNNLIDQIVAIEVEWQREMMKKYPVLMQLGRPLDEEDSDSVSTSFVKYLRGELETYSEETLALLYKDVTESHARKENQAEQVYSHLVKSHGYGSIEEAEAAAERRLRGNK